MRSATDFSTDHTLSLQYNRPTGLSPTPNGRTATEDLVQREEPRLPKSETETIARAVFAEIAKRFPSLTMVENFGDPVEISITMPVQPGFSQEVWLCLQNYDELGFRAGHFYNEWFPCTKSTRAEDYLHAVTGFLSGQHRILEHYRGGKCYRAQLQKSEGDRWRTIATWATIWIPLSFRKSVKELRNQ
jgi:hypothetical protein